MGDAPTGGAWHGLLGRKSSNADILWYNGMASEPGVVLLEPPQLVAAGIGF